MSNNNKSNSNSGLKPCPITNSNESVRVLVKAYDQATHQDEEVLICEQTGLVYVNEPIRENKSYKGDVESLTQEEWNKSFPDDLDVYSDESWGETYQDSKDVYDWQYENVANYIGKDQLNRPGFTIVEIGSARGYLLKRLKENHPQINAIGVEPSPIMGKIARSNGLDMRTGVFEDIGFEPGSVDAIVGFGCFIQVRDPLRTLKAFNRALRPDGRVVLDSPNSDSMFRYALLYFYRRPKLTKMLGLQSFVKKGIDLAYNPGRYFFYSPKTYRLLLEKAGFEVTEVKQRQPRYVVYGKHQLGVIKGLALKGVSTLEKITNKQAWVQVGARKVNNV